MSHMISTIMSNMVRRKAPLLIIVLLAISIFTVGAYNLWWQSGVVTHEITVHGMDAFLMPSTPAGYYAQTTATVLTDGDVWNGGNNFQLDNCVILAIDDALFSGDIHLKSSVSSSYPGTVSAKVWFCTVGYLQETISDRIYLIDYGIPIDLPTDGNPIILTEEQARDIYWTDNSLTGTILPTGFTQSEHINGVFIQFEFSGVAIPFGVYGFDIMVSLDGT